MVALAASRIVLRLLVQAFAPHAPLILGLDDTIERRWDARITARGIYRDPGRYSRSHFLKVRGLRWLCIMLLVPIPWTERVWALPFFDHPVSVRTLSRATRQTAQDPDRLSAPNDQASPTLGVRVGYLAS